MDRYEAQYQFWASFGVPAFEANSVPDEDRVSFPYITYQAVTGQFDTSTMINASIWTRGSSWAEADALADQIETALEDGGKLLPFDGGNIWIQAGTPFSSSMGDPADDLIRRKLLNVVVVFHTVRARGFA